MQGTETAADVWLSVWTGHLADRGTGLALSDASYLAVYAAMAIGVVLVATARNFMWFNATYHAAKRLHEQVCATRCAGLAGTSCIACATSVFGCLLVNVFMCARCEGALWPTR